MRLSLPAQARIRDRYRTLPKLWRALEDHRRDPRSRGDHQDPYPSALARARTAQLPPRPSGLIAHSSFLPSGLAIKPRIARALALVQAAKPRRYGVLSPMN